MLSTKVVYAIETIAELASCSPDKTGRYVMKRSDLERKCEMDLLIGRSVMNELHKYGYISRNAVGYTLVKKAEEISLYELVELFHGGVVIGELLVSMFGRGNYQENPRYRKLARFEPKLDEQLKERLLKIKVSDLVMVSE